MNYLITGSTGFLGKQLCEYLEIKQIKFTSCVKKKQKPTDFETGDLTQFNDWISLFDKIDIVIHCAGKAHDMSNSPELPKLYSEVNHKLTIRMAENAKKYGVKRFIFISTVKVNGEFTLKPFTEKDCPNPKDDYSRSKYLAEQDLMLLHEPNVFEIVIIRPCLIYGPEVKANFKNLINLVKKKLPLPFLLVRNLRSYISVDNLIDLILICSIHPKSGGQIFLASDNEDLSLPELIKKIGEAFEIKTILIPFPPRLLKVFLAIIGKQELSRRLFSSLQVDIEKTKNTLNWKPVFPMLDTLKKMTKD
jgi:nucleoside-diphosphate-sugar epimerase